MYLSALDEFFMEKVAQSVVCKCLKDLTEGTGTPGWHTYHPCGTNIGTPYYDLSFI